MSEHWLEKKFELIDLLAICFVVMCLSILVGECLGLLEMKKWQDSYYGRASSGDATLWL